MFTRIYCTLFNFWNLRVRDVVGSVVPVTSHTFGNPEQRELVWLGVTLKRWIVSPEEARKTRQDDIEMMRTMMNRRRR
jgi:hypothetical protein